MFLKQKPIRLKGRKKIKLFEEVYDRDRGLCVECGKWIEPGNIPHHIVKKSQGGEDTLENLQMLCMEHHSKHH